MSSLRSRRGGIQNPERIYDETGPRLVQTDYRQCFHPRKRNGGISRLGQQRWVCRFCGEHFTENRRRRDFIDEIRIIAPLFKNGKSPSEAATLTGMSILAVTCLYRWFQRVSPKLYPYEIQRVSAELLRHHKRSRGNHYDFRKDVK